MRVDTEQSRWQLGITLKRDQKVRPAPEKEDKMSAIKVLKDIRDNLAKDVATSKKEYERQVKELRTLSETVRAAEATLEAKNRFLANIEAALRVINTTETTTVAPTRKRVGRPPKTDKVETVAKNTKTTKVAKAPKAQKQVKAVAKTDAAPKRGRRSTAEGRRAVAEGLRPPIKDAITKVLGNRTLTIGEIFDGLKEKNWLPNSAEPRQYISYLLSTSKDRFERAPNGRGIYRVVQSNGVTNGSTKKVKANTAETSTGMSTDEILASAGDILGEAVFGG